jgi:probable selenium-dependent hydroxylase accessory protein YqeC
MQATRNADLFKKALGLRERESISLVGGGGKTTLMFLLGKTLAAQGRRVITTTTTKIFEPRTDETPFLSLGEDEGTVLARVEHYGHVTVASHRVPGGKLQGITVRQVDALWESGGIDYLINEADGAAQRPLKAPESYEPVIPLRTSVLVALVGADAFGATLAEDKVFRSHIFSRLTGLPLGAPITYETIATVLTHNEGITKGVPKSARIIPFVNKVELDDGLRKGQEFARIFLNSADERIDRVVLGQLRSDPPIAEVIFR